MDLIGKRLGQFEITAELGQGGMAAVYKAYQANLQRYVAIKVLLPALAADIDLVRRFLREAQSAAALHHSNVITIHDVGSQEDIHYIVMEYLEGMTLSELLAEIPNLPVERTLNIIRQVADALDYAHTKGFIHRDIKPSNIMVDPNRNDHITLMDFGLVRATSGSRLTRTGFIMGTPDYMSPEQARGDPVDRRTDIYSLGVMMYHMMTGSVPFAKPTPHAILLAHIMDEPPPMVAAGGPISRQIEGVVRKAMAKEPDQRYDWSGEMVADLEVAVNKPETFVMPAMDGLMAPYQSPGAIPVQQTPPGGMGAYGQQQTLPAGAPYQTPSGGVAGFPPTPPPGAMPYGQQQTPPPGYGYAQTPLGGVPQAKPKRRVWPVVLIVLFVVAGLTVAGFFFGPTIMDMINPPTATVVAALATETPAPDIVQFVVSPLEIEQGDQVTIEWEVVGVESVSIEPGLRQDAPTTGLITDKPSETTTYMLVLPDGTDKAIEVKVNLRPGAPQVESFTVEPAEPLQGQQVTIAWQITGEVTNVEIDVNYQPRWTNLPAEGTLTAEFDSITTLVLVATGRDAMKSSRTIDVNVLAPTSTPLPTTTSTPEPPTATPTSEPRTVTPTSPPTPTTGPTATRATASTPVSRPTSAPSSGGVVVSFENFGTWRRGDQPYGVFNQSSSLVKSGSYSGKLSYDFSAASESDDFVIFEQKTSVSGTPSLITLWVYGDGSGHFVNIWVLDSEGEMWSFNVGQIFDSGWQQMSGSIDPAHGWPSGHVYGPDNGVVDYPVRFSGIVVDRAGGPKTGDLYFDDIAFTSGGTVTEPGATPQATTVSQPSGIGRIIFTIQVDKSYYLYSTDPSWSTAVEIGTTTWENSTCADSNVARTLDGKTVNLRPVNNCPIAGTVGSCPAPNGEVKVNTSNDGKGNFAVTLVRASDSHQIRAYFVGKLDLQSGINWAPDSSHFLYTDQQGNIYRSDVDGEGYRVILGGKSNEWPAQFTGDGSYLFFLKGSDIHIIRSDGTGERNITNAPISKKLCPKWKN